MGTKGGQDEDGSTGELEIIDAADLLEVPPEGPEKQPQPEAKPRTRTPTGEFVSDIMQTIQGALGSDEMGSTQADKVPLEDHTLKRSELPDPEPPEDLFAVPSKGKPEPPPPPPEEVWEEQDTAPEPEEDDRSFEPRGEEEPTARHEMILPPAVGPEPDKDERWDGKTAEPPWARIPDSDEASAPLPDSAWLKPKPDEPQAEDEPDPEGWMDSRPEASTIEHHLDDAALLIEATQSRLASLLLGLRLCGLYLLLRGVFFLVQFLAVTALPGRDSVRGLSAADFFDIFFRGDAPWFMKIVEQGYTGDTAAFLPLYPLLTRYLGALVGSHHVAGLLISNLAAIVAVYFIYRIGLWVVSREDVERGVVLLLVFPGSIFLSTYGADSLFLLALAASVYFFMRRRYVLAG
ncbi:hypothetical protein ACFL6C_04760, partial [Myxococcota bacterium]